MKKWFLPTLICLHFSGTVTDVSAQTTALTEQDFDNHIFDTAATDLNGYVAYDSSEFQTLPAGAGITCSQWQRGPGLVPTGAQNGYNARSFTTTGAPGPEAAALEGKYYHFSITVAENYTLTIDEITWKTKRSNTGPTHFQWQYATQSGGMIYQNMGGEIILSVDSPKSITVTPYLPISVSGDVIRFRILAWGATGGHGTARIANGTKLNATVLPLTLLSFTARPVQDQVILNWETAKESNVKGFELQESRDASAFTTIGFVPAQNKILNSYQFTTQLPAATAFFRLKIIDRDETFSFSPVQRTTGKKSPGMVQLHPNPAATFLFLSGVPAEASIGICDMQGRRKLHSGLDAEGSELKLNISALPAGHYSVDIKNGGVVTRHRFVKN